ncbi:C4-dicarboxylate ABC transporter substrate-binding protein [Bacillaceae bacterium JMAK1]|nr:C4-dicarboxylate ABC transporter substrate-binding protein [Bacillaceae bacterium JMAK1]
MKFPLRISFLVALTSTFVLASCGIDSASDDLDTSEGESPTGAETIDEDDVDPDETEDSSENNEDVITIEVGHVAPPNEAYSIGMEAFAEQLLEETDGSIELSIYGGGQLGGERDMVEQITFGTLDMGLITSGPVGNFVPELAVLEMPFLFESTDHVYETVDGEIGDELLGYMENANMVGLGIWENGFRHFSNDSHPILHPDDLSGLTMRTIENDMHVDTYNALGASPTPIAWPETYSSIQQGIVDGLDTSYGVFESGNLFEVQDYYTETNLYYASAYLIMNQDRFDSLPEDVQDTLRTLGRSFASEQRAINQDMEVEQKQHMIDEGMEIVDHSEVDIEAFRESVQSVYDRHADSFGDYVERITNLNR